MDTQPEKTAESESGQARKKSGPSRERFADIRDILQDNLARQQAYEKPINISDKKSRKARDYLLCMVLVNMLLLLPNLLLGGNVVVMVFSFSGMVIFSSGFTWIMWKVIGDY